MPSFDEIINVCAIWYSLFLLLFWPDRPKNLPDRAVFLHIFVTVPQCRRLTLRLSVTYFFIDGTCTTESVCDEKDGNCWYNDVTTTHNGR